MDLFTHAIQYQGFFLSFMYTKTHFHRSIYSTEFRKSVRFHKKQLQACKIMEPKFGNFYKEMYVRVQHSLAEGLPGVQYFPEFACLRVVRLSFFV